MFAAPVYIVNGPEPAECLQRSCGPPPAEARTAHCFYARVRNCFASPPSVSPSLPYAANGKTVGTVTSEMQVYQVGGEIDTVTVRLPGRSGPDVGQCTDIDPLPTTRRTCSGSRIPGYATVCHRRIEMASRSYGARFPRAIGDCKITPEICLSLASARHPPACRAGVGKGFCVILPKRGVLRRSPVPLRGRKIEAGEVKSR